MGKPSALRTSLTHQNSLSVADQRDLDLRSVVRLERWAEVAPRQGKGKGKGGQGQGTVQAKGKGKVKGPSTPPRKGRACKKQHRPPKGRATMCTRHAKSVKRAHGLRSNVLSPHHQNKDIAVSLKRIKRHVTSALPHDRTGPQLSPPKSKGHAARIVGRQRLRNRIPKLGRMRLVRKALKSANELAGIVFATLALAYGSLAPQPETQTVLVDVDRPKAPAATLRAGAPQSKCDSEEIDAPFVLVRHGKKQYRESSTNGTCCGCGDLTPFQCLPCVGCDQSNLNRRCPCVLCPACAQERLYCPCHDSKHTSSSDLCSQFAKFPLLTKAHRHDGCHGQSVGSQFAKFPLLTKANRHDGCHGQSVGGMPEPNVALGSGIQLSIERRKTFLHDDRPIGLSAAGMPEPNVALGSGIQLSIERRKTFLHDDRPIGLTAAGMPDHSGIEVSSLDLSESDVVDTTVSSDRSLQLLLTRRRRVSMLEAYQHADRKNTARQLSARSVAKAESPPLCPAAFENEAEPTCATSVLASADGPEVERAPRVSSLSEFVFGVLIHTAEAVPADVHSIVLTRAERGLPYKPSRYARWARKHPSAVMQHVVRAVVFLVNWHRLSVRTRMYEEASRPRSASKLTEADAQKLGESVRKVLSDHRQTVGFLLPKGGVSRVVHDPIRSGVDVPIMMYRSQFGVMAPPHFHPLRCDGDDVPPVSEGSPGGTNAARDSVLSPARGKRVELRSGDYSETPHAFALFGSRDGGAHQTHAPCSSNVCSGSCAGCTVSHLRGGGPRIDRDSMRADDESDCARGVFDDDGGCSEDVPRKSKGGRPAAASFVCSTCHKPCRREEFPAHVQNTIQKIPIAERVCSTCYNPTIGRPTTASFLCALCDETYTREEFPSHIRKDIKRMQVEKRICSKCWDNTYECSHCRRCMLMCSRKCEACPEIHSDKVECPNCHTEMPRAPGSEKAYSNLRHYSRTDLVSPNVGGEDRWLPKPVCNSCTKARCTLCKERPSARGRPFGLRVCKTCEDSHESTCSLCNKHGTFLQRGCEREGAIFHLKEAKEHSDVRMCVSCYASSRECDTCSRVVRIQDMCPKQLRKASDRFKCNYCAQERRTCTRCNEELPRCYFDASKKADCVCRPCLAGSGLPWGPACELIDHKDVLAPDADSRRGGLQDEIENWPKPLEPTQLRDMLQRFGETQAAGAFVPRACSVCACLHPGQRVHDLLLSENDVPELLSCLTREEYLNDWLPTFHRLWSSETYFATWRVESTNRSEVPLDVLRQYGCAPLADFATYPDRPESLLLFNAHSSEAGISLKVCDSCLPCLKSREAAEKEVRRRRNLGDDGEVDAGHLRKEKSFPALPPKAVAAGLFVGALPDALKQLTLAEVTLLRQGRICPVLCMCRPNGMDASKWQHGSRGIMTAFPIDQEEFLSACPAPLDSLPRSILVHFAGPLNEAVGNSQQLRVRPSVIRRALLWLGQNNPAYERFLSDESREALRQGTLAPEEAELRADARQRCNEYADIVGHEGSVPDCLLRAAIPHIEEKLRNLGAADACVNMDDGCEERVQGDKDTDQPLAVVDHHEAPGSIHEKWNAAYRAIVQWRDHVDGAAKGDIVDDPELERSRLNECMKGVASLRDLTSSVLSDVSATTAHFAVHQKGDIMPSFSPAMWQELFPEVWPYGAGVLFGSKDKSRPSRYVNNRDLASVLVQRADLPHVRKNLTFVAAAFSTLLRLEQLQAIRFVMQLPSFSEDLQTIATVTPDDFLAADMAIGKYGTAATARHHPDVLEGVKALLNKMEMVERRTPYTDGYRTEMRYELQGLRAFVGPALVFFTLNPNDGEHPFTLVFSDATGERRCPLNGTPAEIAAALGEDARSVNEDLQEGHYAAQNCRPLETKFIELLRQDPTTSLMCFTKLTELVYECIFDCALTSDQLPSDGVADLKGRGALGRVSAHYSVKEIQARGSYHLHALFMLLGFKSPRAFYEKLKSNWEPLLERCVKWCSALVCHSSEGFASYLSGLGDNEEAEMHPELARWYEMRADSLASEQSIPRSILCPEIAVLGRPTTGLGVQHNEYLTASQKRAHEAIRLAWDENVYEKYSEAGADWPLGLSKEARSTLAQALLNTRIPLYNAEASPHPSYLVPEHWALGFDPTNRRDFAVLQPAFYRETRALLPDAEWAFLTALDFDSGFRASCHHRCLPNVCFKGRFAAQQLCRFRFWHLVKTERMHGKPTARGSVYLRYKGKALCDELNGAIGPDGGLCPHRIHPFALNCCPPVFLAARCNHDMSIMLKLPPAFDAAPPTASKEDDGFDLDAASETCSSENGSEGSSSDESWTDSLSGSGEDSDSASSCCDHREHNGKHSGLGGSEAHIRKIPPQSFPQDSGDRDELRFQHMANAIASAGHYISDYIAKNQDKATRVFQLLADGLRKSNDRARLTHELIVAKEAHEEVGELSPDHPAFGAADLATRLHLYDEAVRILRSLCAEKIKKTTKSFPEMLSFLHQLPERYSSHSFTNLGFGPHVRALATSLGETEEPYGPQTTGPLLSRDSDGQKVVKFYARCRDYFERPVAMGPLPLYFFASAVAKVLQKDCVDTALNVPFNYLCTHPKFATEVLRVQTCEAWKVPVLIGPTLPHESIVAKKSLRYKILLTLFRPHTDPTEQADYVRLAGSLEAAWTEYETALRAEVATSAPVPRDLCSFRYWAHRIVPVLDNLEMITLGALKGIDPTIPAEAYLGKTTYLCTSKTPLCFAPEDIDEIEYNGLHLDESPDFGTPVHEIAAGFDARVSSSQEEYMSTYTRLASRWEPRLLNAKTQHAKVADPVVHPNNAIRADIETQYASHSLRDSPPVDAESKKLKGAPDVEPLVKKYKLKFALDRSSDDVRASAQALIDHLTFSCASCCTRVAEHSLVCPHCLESGTVKCSAFFRDQRDPAYRHVPEQVAAFLLVADWVAEKYAFLINESSVDPPPLRMVLLGAGGSGKTYVITVMKAFINFWLKKGAAQQLAFLNSVAAMVDGKTVHSALGLSFGNGADTSGAGAATQALDGIHSTFGSCEAVFVDEISMISSTLLAKMSERLCTLKKSQEPFGNLTFIASGDFLQLPPVRATSLAYPLETTPTSELGKYTDKQQSNFKVTQTGRDMWLALTTVVQLQQSQRSHGALAEILHAMRTNSLTAKHHDALARRRVDSVPNGPRILEHAPFTQSPRKFLTYRHAVRMRRRASLCRFAAREHGEPLLYSVAYDQGPYARDLDKRKQLVQHSALSSTSYLPGLLPLYVGMDAILTRTISKKHRLVKGTLVTVRQIVLDEREPVAALNDDVEAIPHQLKYVPHALLIEAKSHDQFESYGTMWLRPVSATFKLALNYDDRNDKKQTKRYQFPLEPACTATAHGIQGQTLNAVEIDFAAPGDLRKPDYGRVYAQMYPEVVRRRDEYWLACYVMLSRATDLDNVAIWRTWDRTLIEMGPPAYLLHELQRLSKLAQRTARTLSSLAAKFSDCMVGIVDRLPLPQIPCAEIPTLQTRAVCSPPDAAFGSEDESDGESDVDGRVAQASCPRCRFDLLPRECAVGNPPEHSPSCIAEQSPKRTRGRMSLPVATGDALSQPLFSEFYDEKPSWELSGIRKKPRVEGSFFWSRGCEMFDGDEEGQTFSGIRKKVRTEDSLSQQAISEWDDDDEVTRKFSGVRKKQRTVGSPVCPLSTRRLHSSTKFKDDEEHALDRPVRSKRPRTGALPTQHLFFERQRQGMNLCGQHALNNVLGRNAVTWQDCSLGAHQAAVEMEENLDLHMDLRGGYFSLTALANTLQVQGEYHFDRVTLSTWWRDNPNANPFDPLEHGESGVAGVVIHEESHWTAMRRVNDEYFYFDSLDPSPVRLSLPEALRQLRSRRHCFRVLCT